MFGGNGLSSPPSSEPLAQTNKPAPVYVDKKGRHYFLPEGMGEPVCRDTSQQVSALEALKRSAAAAGNNHPSMNTSAAAQPASAIAHGSSRPITREPSKAGSGKMVDIAPDSVNPDPETNTTKQELPVAADHPERLARVFASTDGNDGSLVVAREETSPSPMPRKGRLDKSLGGDVETTPVPAQETSLKRSSLSGQGSSSVGKGILMPRRPATSGGQSA